MTELKVTATGNITDIANALRLIVDRIETGFTYGFDRGEDEVGDERDYVFELTKQDD